MLFLGSRAAFRLQKVMECEAAKLGRAGLRAMSSDVEDEEDTGHAGLTFKLACRDGSG